MRNFRFTFTKYVNLLVLGSFLTLTANAAPISKFYKKLSSYDGTQNYILGCEIFDDKVVITKGKNGIGGSMERPFRMSDSTKLRAVFAEVVKYNPRPFQAKSIGLNEFSKLEVFPDAKGKGISIYSVKGVQVRSHEFIHPMPPHGSTIGPYFSTAFKQIRSICETFGGIDIGGTRWPGGGA